MSYSSEVLADSPIFYLRLEETSGATCANTGSIGGNATAQGTFTRNVTSAATTGVGITLAGATTSYISYPDDTSLDLTGDFTYECWIKVSSYAADQTLISKNFQSTGVGGYCLRILATTRIMRVIKSGVAVLADATTAIPNDSGWHHVAVTRSGNTYTFYIDGASAGTGTASTTINATNQVLSVGMERLPGFGDFNPLDGSIDEVAVYGTALSGARIATHYSVGSTSTTVVAPFIASATALYAPALTHSSQVEAPYIDATSAVYAPTLSGSGTATLLAPYLAPTTAVYTPDVGRFTAPFVAAATAVYTPTLRRVGMGAQPVGVSIGFADDAGENAPTWNRLDA